RPFELRNLVRAEEGNRGLHVGGDGVAIREADDSRSVPRLDYGEMTKEHLLDPLAGKRPGRPRWHAEELAELLEMVRIVRHRHQPAAGTENARQLAERPVDVRHVVEHPGRDRAVEGSVLEGKILDVADARGDAPAPGEVDHSRRDVEP